MTTGDRERKGGWGLIVRGCLIWFVIVFALLALLEHFAARPSPEEAGLPGRHAPETAAPAEGPSRHQ